MKFICISSVVLCALLICGVHRPVQSFSIPTDGFTEKISTSCFNTTWENRDPLTLGQRFPVGNSIDNLISLIEKIEDRNPTFSLEDIVTLILKRFHFDGLRFDGSTNSQSDVEQTRTDITNQILDADPKQPSRFNEADLSEDEKCSLFYMLSHTVNETARYSDKDTFTRQYYSRAPSQTGQSVGQAVQSSYLANPSQGFNQGSRPVSFASTLQRVTSRPREIGVSSFRNNLNEAISTNRVLLGIAAGISYIPATGKSVRQIVSVLAPTVNIEKVVDGQLDKLYAVTLSDLVGIGSDKGLGQNQGQVKFGAAGLWNSTACSTEYRLERNGTDATLAELKGGIDGYNIGRRIRDIIQKVPNIKLSIVLRNYYSPRGFQPIYGDVGVCSRQSALSELNQKLKDEGINYLRLYNGVKHRAQHPDPTLLGYVEQAYSQFSQYLQEAAQLRLDSRSSMDNFCNNAAIGGSIRDAPCETPADVFFLVDANGNLPETTAIITEVTKQLDIRRRGGTVTVLANSNSPPEDTIYNEDRQPINNFPLYPIAYNQTSTQCATCKVAWLLPSRLPQPIKDREVLMQYINETLKQYEWDTTRTNYPDRSGVPSKSFVWFDYENLKKIPTDREPRRKYDDFRWKLRYEHRDVSYFLLALNLESVRDLTRQDADFFKVSNDVNQADDLATNLLKKICQTPATFRHTECRTMTSSSKEYKGFLTPGFKQYWAMYPEFFIKSYTIQLRFRSESKIRVCYSRWNNPENDEPRNCRDNVDRTTSGASTSGGEIFWEVKNPCDGFNFENCRPFYFTLMAPTDTPNNNACSDGRCKSVEQVEWVFSHSGIACSGALTILPSMVSQIACFIIFVVFYFNRK